MTMHIFGTVLTARGVAANNRGENEGSMTTLQKVVRGGNLHTTVSSEAVRYAIRELWGQDGDLETNRKVSHRGNEWADKDFGKGWEKFIDNDVLGFMHAKKETVSRRGILEIGRAVSTTPWPGTIAANFASPGANPSVSHNDPVPYAGEIHDTRYQFSFAMTPDALEGENKLARTEATLRALQSLRRVGGNHGRYLYDFSPESVVFRVTQDPAPRIMFVFEEGDNGELSLLKLGRRLEGTEPDIRPEELIVGTLLDDIQGLDELRKKGVTVLPGIKAAVSEVLQRLGGALAA